MHCPGDGRRKARRAPSLQGHRDRYTQQTVPRPLSDPAGSEHIHTLPSEVSVTLPTGPVWAQNVIFPASALTLCRHTQEFTSSRPCPGSRGRDAAHARWALRLLLYPRPGAKPTRRTRPLSGRAQRQQAADGGCAGKPKCIKEGAFPFKEFSRPRPSSRPAGDAPGALKTPL